MYNGFRKRDKDDVLVKKTTKGIIEEIKLIIPECISMDTQQSVEAEK